MRVKKRMVTQQCPILGFRLHDAPHMSDVGEDKLQRGNSALLVATDLSHPDSRGYILPPQTRHFIADGFRKVPINIANQSGVCIIM